MRIRYPIVHSVTQLRVGRRGWERPGGLIEDVGVDHGGLQAAVAQKLLDGADVLVAFKQVHRQGPQDSQHRCTDPVSVAVGVLTVTAGISPWRVF